MPRFDAPDGRALHYLDEGQGTAVLCLPGLTRNHRDFDPVAARLKGRFRILRLDSRGRGGSDRAEDPQTEYQLPVEAGDVLALIDHLGLTRAALVGTSRGGMLSGLVAAMRPGLLTAVAVNDVGPRIEAAGLRRIAAYVGAPPPKTFAEAAAALKSANEGQFPGVPLSRWETHACATYDETDGALVLAYDPAIAEMTRAAVAGLSEDHIDAAPVFAALSSVPLLVIRGGNSDLFAEETARSMVEGRDDATFVTVPDRGHVPFLDEPEAVSSLDAFLNRYAAP